MNILAVIPARGGSKGIPHKNITPLSGKPLLTYTIEAATDAGCLTDIVVSTDDEAIMRVAEQSGAKRIMPGTAAGKDAGAGDACGTQEATGTCGLWIVERPADISGDTASTEAALLHALSVMEEQTGASYDAVMCLQPTSPFRKPETIRAFAAQFERDQDRFDALLTLHETKADHWVRHADGHFARLYPDAPRRRQERDPLYIENSAIYLTLASALKETKSVLGRRVNGFVITEREGVDINEPVDLVIAEGMLHAEQGNDNAACGET